MAEVTGRPRSGVSPAPQQLQRQRSGAAARLWGILSASRLCCSDRACTLCTGQLAPCLHNAAHLLTLQHCLLSKCTLLLRACNAADCASAPPGVLSRHMQLTRSSYCAGSLSSEATPEPVILQSPFSSPQAGCNGALSEQHQQGTSGKPAAANRFEVVSSVLAENKARAARAAAAHACLAGKGFCNGQLMQPGDSPVSCLPCKRLSQCCEGVLWLAACAW